MLLFPLKDLAGKWLIFVNEDVQHFLDSELQTVAASYNFRMFL